MEGMDMQILPTTYKSWGDVLQKYSEDVIREVQKNNKTYNYVVDLGSGLGNNTELLFKCLQIDRLFGIDIDQNMVEYARSRKSSNKIRFVAENVSKDWVNLDNEVKELNGKVDLILSSFVLHFIANRKTTSDNLFRLLAPGGVFYANVICLSDKFTPEANGTPVPMKIPSSQQQLDLWAEALKDAGFKIEKTKLYKLETTMPTETYAKTFASIISICYEIFMTEPNAEKRKQLVRKVKDKMIDSVTKYNGDMNGTQMVRCECDIFTIKVVKQ